MKKIIILLLFLLSMVFSVVSVQALSVVNSKHDFSVGGTPGSAFKFNTEKVCVFCHTPHHANTVVISAPLWNRTSNRSSANFTLYSSPTFQGAATANLDTTGYSLLCLSCHDGATAINSVINYWGESLSALYTVAGQPAEKIGQVTPIGVNIGGLDPAGNIINAAINNSLTNDHPVGFQYNASLVLADRSAGGFAADQLATPDNVNGYVVDKKVRLFGSGKDRLECGSCHDPHDNQFGKFLVKSNAGSALCMTCHLK